MPRTVRALALVLLGALLGAGVAGFLARRLAITMDRDSRYAEALSRAGTNGRVLRALDARQDESARAVLERDLLLALAAAEDLGAQGASLPLSPLFAGPALGELAEVEAYARTHNLDRAVIERVERVQARLCAALSPNSKYRGLCK